MEDKPPPHEVCIPVRQECHGGSQAQAAATQNLVELGCCKLKKVYALCENFIYTGPLPVLSPGQGSVPGLAGLLGLAGLAGLAVIHDKELGMKCHQQPPNSPDLKPLENI